MNAIQESIMYKAIESFLNINYPCPCKDDECSGNADEAGALVDLVKAIVNP